ncbi:putative repeat protein (TIGR02059 family) [Pseudomonas sp. JUb42]|uniref:SwmB domain-containing protein n=1 Tax=Pseudomonas sp. JUb42 TaxID=2940611 RepID=UPI00216829EC|nr:SwmB domain-containing protein [Pseudomonas sp. JUb42]MCS3472603.1 putative repeat protein (TIGR02059 family) [Pseudomonas sp. JUb42]
MTSITSINRVTGTNTNASSLEYTVTFDSAVTGVDTGDFLLSATGSATGTITSLTPAGNVYTVTVSGVSGDGTLRLDLNSSGTGIVDGSSNPITSGYTSGQAYTLDHTGPSVGSVGVPADATYTTGDNLDFTVNFNEATTVDTTGGTPRLAVTLSTGTVYANYVSGSGGTALTFRYTVVAGNADADGVSVGGSLDLNGGTIKDAVGNNSTLTLNSVASTAGVLVSAPVLAVPPVFSSAAVTGNSLVLSYTEATTLDAVNKPANGAFEVKVGGVVDTVTAVTINAVAKTATLTLNTAVVAGQAVTVAYTDPTAGDDTNALQNAAGTDAVSLAATAVTNNTPTVPPVFSSAAVTGSSLVVSYTEATTLDAVNKPATNAYQVKVNGVVDTVTAVTIDAAAKTATLTLNTAVAAGQTVTVAYTDPTVGDDANALQNAAGTDAVSLAATAVTNNTVAPVVGPSAPSVGVTLTAPAGGGTLQGTAQADVLIGSGSKDIFYPAGGADSVDGGSGIDTVVLTGARAQYGISHQADGTFTVRSLTDANTVVTLKNVERVTFDNQTIALDSTTTSGRVAEFYHLALGRNPEEGGLDLYSNASNQSLSTAQLALNFVNSLEFARIHNTTDNTAFVTQLYQSAFNRAPDATGLAFFLNQLAANPGAAGQAAVIANFIDSPEMAVKLAGVVDQGVALLAV